MKNDLETTETLLAQLGELLPPPKSEPGETRQMLALVLRKLDGVTARLDKIESDFAAQKDAARDSLLHPSLQTFELPESTEFLPNTNIKACTFEPNGKPCDNCALCNSRGF